MSEEARCLWSVYRDGRKDLVEHQGDWGVAVDADPALLAHTKALFGGHALHGVAVDACQHAVKCVSGQSVVFIKSTLAILSSVFLTEHVLQFSSVLWDDMGGLAVMSLWSVFANISETNYSMYTKSRLVFTTEYKAKRPGFARDSRKTLYKHSLLSNNLFPNDFQYTL